MSNGSSGAALIVEISGIANWTESKDILRLQCPLSQSYKQCDHEVPYRCFGNVNVSHLVGNERGGSLYIRTTMDSSKVAVSGSYKGCVFGTVRYAVSIRLTSKLIPYSDLLMDQMTLPVPTFSLTEQALRRLLHQNLHHCQSAVAREA